MRARLFFAVVLLASAPAGAADKTAMGDVAVKEGLRIVPSYLTGAETDKKPAGGPDWVYFEADIHATRDEAHGFAEGAWMPYLTVAFALTKDGAPTYKKGGFLFPVAAKDGPQYASAVEMAGPGAYHLTYIISPPTSHGLMRRVDKAGGVPDWWKPISVSWTFNYPSKSQ